MGTLGLSLNNEVAPISVGMKAAILSGGLTPPLGNLVGWWESGRSVFTTAGGSTACAADNDPCGRIANLTPSGSSTYDFLQASSGKRGTFKTGILGTNPVIRFSGSDQFMATTTLAASLAPPFTIIMVAKRSGGTGQAFLDGDVATTCLLRRNGGGNWDWFSGGKGDCEDGAADANWHIFTLIGPEASGVSRFFIDGSLASFDTHDANTLAGLTLFSWADEEATVPTQQGDFAAALVYNANLNGTTRLTEAWAYLNTKYAIY